MGFGLRRFIIQRPLDMDSQTAVHFEGGMLVGGVVAEARDIRG